MPWSDIDTDSEKELVCNASSLVARAGIIQNVAPEKYCNTVTGGWADVDPDTVHHNADPAHVSQLTHATPSGRISVRPATPNSDDELGLDCDTFCGQPPRFGQPLVAASPPSKRRVGRPIGSFGSRTERRLFSTLPQCDDAVTSALEAKAVGNNPI